MVCNLFNKCEKEKGKEMTGFGVFIRVVKNWTQTFFFVFYCYDFNYSVNVILLPGFPKPLPSSGHARRLINGSSPSDRCGDKLLPAKHINYRGTEVIFHFTNLFNADDLYSFTPKPSSPGRVGFNAFLSCECPLSAARPDTANKNKYTRTLHNSHTII